MKILIEYLINNNNTVKINSNDINKDDVFIALKGTQSNGNDYIDHAIEKGAKYIITESKTKLNQYKNKIFHVDKILKFLEKTAIEKRYLYEGKTIGITGSIGKTSVKENLNYFLSKKFKVSYSIKSYNNYLGVLISLINIDLKSNYAILELGTNNFLEIRKLTSLVKPQQVIITNIFPTHLEKLISTTNIAIEKADIFNKKYNPNIRLTILPNNNIDEKILITKAKNQNINEIITFGKKNNSDLLIKKLSKYKDNLYKIDLVLNKESFFFFINQNQIHRIENILICFIIFVYNEIDLELFSSLSKYVPLIEGRGIRKYIYLNNKKIDFIDESYNASPHSMQVCVDYFNDLKTNHFQKKYLILGDMKELGDSAIDFHVHLLAYISKKNLNNVIICGELMQRALIKINDNKIIFMLDVNSIKEYIYQNINTNDILLIKGSNSSMTNILTKKLLNTEEK
jgi:UDP-N-acetylmuramoyl-tripeptide--D-alanyl-D-alanine ligase